MHVKSFVTILILIISGYLVSGKEKSRSQYACATIDSSMKKEAWAVCRNYHHEFQLLGYGKAVERIRLVITVLDKRGDEMAELVLPYDKSTKISSLTGKSYDMFGQPDEKLRKSNIQDLNYTSAGAIYDDIRMKKATFSGNSYPYTVEYNYEIEYNGLISYPEWHPIDEYHLSVEESSFQISYPDSMVIRYREFHLPSGCRTEKIEKGVHYLEWKLDTLKAWREEPMSDKLYLETPYVVTAPTRFIYDGYPGSMNTWKEYGQWINKLNEGRDLLPEKRQNEIRELVREVKDTAKIVRILYEYMQNRTRYVGIQLGIGGFQPFPAETVDRLGYGDCKALSNYMKALLKAVGIPSVYTVAGAAYNQGITMTDFPTNNQSNHIILCVPLRNDTLWLECTSQTAPCGYLDLFTAGRKALNITAEGGKVVNTPLLTANQSSQDCMAEIKVNSEGSIHATVKTKYSGYQYDNISQILTASKKEQERVLYEKLSISGLNISDFNYQVKKDKLPQAFETIIFTTPTFATKTGTRLFIPLNIFNQIKSAPSRVDNRKMAVYRAYTYHDRDSVIILLPGGFKAESIPQGKTIVSEFGEYQSTISLKDNQVLYIRELKMNRGTWPKERYTALVDFYSAMVNADKVRLVLKEESK